MCPLVGSIIASIMCLPGGFYNIQQTYGFLPPMNYHEDEVKPDKLEEVEGEGSYEHKEDESEEPMIVYLELFKEKYGPKKPEKYGRKEPKKYVGKSK
ncbi:hypothetical protein RHMOL_Rhmol07G0223100 [Rhododendron molle]|uniref:Uncharacterized protein n=1 Tax=Rhododendron molle TaxID=49168 RepID=A0ACC0N465_RHOML|nr:hypothetical protein RHMOL_Rhmol07G0223100 [Rhododendron molle]